jgi:CDP-2,3-bis-(O-geranylgeranyl)-sn-glycerol synthase
VISLWLSLQDWLWALYIILPVYCTNGAPVIFGGGRPIDSGRFLSDGQRVFGDHKTIRGFVSGLLAGLTVGAFESILFHPNLMSVAILASFGALLGDLAGAFLKRRLKISPGGSLPVLDQLDFVLGAMLFVSPFVSLSLGTAAILLLVTPPIHILTNLVAHALGLKSTYW